MSLSEIVEAWAEFYDEYIGYGTGDTLRNAWRELFQAADPCDCPPTHHRWNCHRTPIYRQTMRDLDINPWTLFTYENFPALDYSVREPNPYTLAAIEQPWCTFCNRHHARGCHL